MRKDKLEELEFRIFELEQNVELLTTKKSSFTDQMASISGRRRRKSVCKREDLLTL